MESQRLVRPTNAWRAGPCTRLGICADLVGLVAGCLHHALGLPVALQLLVGICWTWYAALAKEQRVFKALARAALDRGGGGRSGGRDGVRRAGGN